MELQIPRAFEAKRDIFLATKKSFIHIEPFATSEILDPWVSKYRGILYLPKNVQYPVDTSGRPLAFLAQINFSEVPKLEGYPTSGILQFFIADDDLYGLEFAEPPSEPYNQLNLIQFQRNQFELQQKQKNFRVIYYPEIIQRSNLLTASFDFLPEFEFLPIYHQWCRLEFSLREEFVGLYDYQFERVFGKGFPERSKLSEEERAELSQYSVNGEMNKIGGYASFAQGDIREIAPADENWLLLLQIASAKNAEIEWGNAGIGNFFIEEKALKALDFSKVLYNWDCA